MISNKPILLGLSLVMLCFKPAAAAGEDMALVPAGEFTMGMTEAQVGVAASSLGGMAKYYDNTTPAHKLNVDAFYMDKYEVTNDDYKKFIEATGVPIPLSWEDAGGDIPKGKGKHPVVYVNWEAADAYCKWAGKRLPTEAEWEKAARGDDGRLFPWGNKFSRKKLNFDKSRKKGTTKVGSYKKGVSSYGCFDMAGNVWEWTADNYLAYPGNKFEDEFYGNERYVLRGGSYMDAKYDVLSTVRSKFTKLTDDENVGFRCAKSASALAVAAPVAPPAKAEAKPKPLARKPKAKTASKPAATAGDASGMVLVPAGEFSMGLDEAQVAKVVKRIGGTSKYYDNTTPAHKLNVAAFYMDKYEVTNDDYKKFIEATGVAIPLSWEDAGGDIPRGKGSHPVVYVNWEAADAYCKWAGKRLPTEAEWEKAARGDDGRLFPWGNKFSRKKLNFEKSRKKGTTKVGSYKKGVSPYGCFDMAGNVWEWTADNYLAYPGNQYEDEFYGNERYVLRGGSFMDTKYDALTVGRNKFTKLTDDENVGFRCAK